MSVCHTAVRLSAQRRNSLWSSATSMWSGLDRRNTMLFMGDAIPEFQVFKHDPVCVCMCACSCVHVRKCVCVCVYVHKGDITHKGQSSKFSTKYLHIPFAHCTSQTPGVEDVGFARVKGQAPGGASMVARESLKAFHLWDSVAHNNLMGEMATSHELPKRE